MNYRNMKKTGDTLSLLGYGCMRFPRKNRGIDETRTRTQILSAFEQGVNYFDTAYLYSGSEKILGSILAEEGIRDKVMLATKLPHILVKRTEDIASLFQKQLDRLQTDYLDYYLIHNVGSFADWQRLKELGIKKFVETERHRGRIRHFGFSFHGNLIAFKQLIDDYPWDFCQIQYNYLDENFQAGKKGLEYTAKKGLGIIIMEPLRGGTLGAKIPEPAKKVLQKHIPDRSPAEWALRWVFSHPQVQVVLSGMNEESHITENIRIASNPDGYTLTEQEYSAIDEVREIFKTRFKVPCTACTYCTPCPHGVDIPTCFAHYNNKSIQGGFMPHYMYIQATEGVTNGKLSKASLCKNCGACRKHCPQQIDIPRHLKEVAQTMEKPWLRYPIRIALSVMK